MEENNIICKICGRGFKSLKSLGIHAVKGHKILKKDYYDKYLKKENEGICPECGKETGFLRLSKGYCKYCSIKCVANSKEVREKFKQTCLMNWDVKNPSQSDKIKNKKISTCLKNNNVEYPFQSEKIKEKITETCLKKYGVNNPSKYKKFKEKSKQTCLEKYGVEYSGQSDIKLNKTKETWIRNWGTDSLSKSPKFKELKRKIFSEKLFSNERILSKVVPLFEKNEYVDVKTLYEWKCKTCNSDFKDHLDNGHIPRCPICYPLLNKGFSILEKEIIEFCKSFYPNLIENDRTILNGKELDIYIPEISLAIEINGLFWHSEKFGKDKYYHVDKTNRCKEKGIRLFHIFEDEWLDKKDTVKSILKAKMGKIDNKIYARKCEIVQVGSDESLDFLDENHIQGSINGTSYGLIYNDELVSILTVGKSRFNKNYEWEIYRFCNKLDLTVTGGFSKLLKAFIDDKSPKSIVTYADKRYSIGDLYSKNGFKLIGESEPNYYYMKKYLIRESRQKYQKHKLQNIIETFDPELTEWENMQLNGYDRIWDCGNYIFSHYFN